MVACGDLGFDWGLPQKYKYKYTRDSIWGKERVNSMYHATLGKKAWSQM